MQTQTTTLLTNDKLIEKLAWTLFDSRGSLGEPSGLHPDFYKDIIAELLGLKAEVGVRLFRTGAKMPVRGTNIAAGFDLHAWVMDNKFNCDQEETNPNPTLKESEVTVHPGTMVPIKTGVNLRIPVGYEVQIRPRSGLAFKNQITIQNTPGTIDADYDGDGEKFEIVVMLRNEGTEPFAVKHGERIAQMVVNKLPEVTLREDVSDNLYRNPSTRDGGLGHTGK